MSFMALSTELFHLFLAWTWIEESTEFICRLRCNNFTAERPHKATQKIHVVGLSDVKVMAVTDIW